MQRWTWLGSESLVWLLKTALASIHCNIRLSAACLTEMTEDGATGGTMLVGLTSQPFLSDQSRTLSSLTCQVGTSAHTWRLPCEPNKDIYENLTKFLQHSTWPLLLWSLSSSDWIVMWTKNRKLMEMTWTLENVRPWDDCKTRKIGKASKTLEIVGLSLH